jgi:hypothetical protein
MRYPVNVAKTAVIFNMTNIVKKYNTLILGIVLE